MNYEYRPKIEYLYKKLSKIDSKYKNNDKNNCNPHSIEFEAITLQNLCNIAVTCNVAAVLQQYCSSVVATLVL